jgi:predicted PurR-regulated permease PerM
VYDQRIASHTLEFLAPLRQSPPVSAPASPASDSLDESSLPGDLAETPPSAATTPGDEPPPLRLHVPIDVRSVSLAVLATVACVFMLHEMDAVLIPIVLAALIFYALAPIVEFLVRWRLPRVVAATLVMVALVGGLAGTAWGLSDEAQIVFQNMPASAEKLRVAVRGLRRQNNDSIAQVQKAANALEQTASEAIGPVVTPRGVMRVQIEQPAFRFTDFLMSGSRNAFVLIGQVATVLFLAFFMLLSSSRLKVIAVEVAGPTLSKKKVTVQILDEITRQVQHFLVILLSTGAIVGVATALAMWWMGLDYPVLWGVVAGVLNSVPYFGPVAVGAGLGTVAFIQFGTLLKATMVAGVAVLITSLEGFLLTPVWQGRAARMNSVAVFVGLLFWSWMWGPIGLLLAVPLTTVVKVVCDHVEQLQPIGRLLGE